MTVYYGDIKKLMHTYDLILFKGTDFISKTINLIEKIEDGEAGFTHVGVVIKGEDLLPCVEEEEKKWLKPESLYILESTMSGDLADGCKDVYGNSYLGVQLRVLDNVVEHYGKPKGAKMAWSAVKNTEYITGKFKMAREIYERYRGLRYDLSIIDITACAFSPIRKIRDNSVFVYIRDAIFEFIYGKNRIDGGEEDDNVVSKWQFCSEMAANIYKDIGLLPDHVNASNVMPMDFITSANDESKTVDSDKEVIPMFETPILFK